MKANEKFKIPERYAYYFIKWLIISLLIGVFGGLIGGSFSLAVTAVTKIRVANDWLIYLMPLSGLLIVFLYNIAGEANNRGTNEVFESIGTGVPVKLTMGPLIYIATVLTHLVGGSSGREGAAIQIGGWVGELVGRIPFLKLRKEEKPVAVAAGTGAVFSALFGTPVAAGLFCIEAVSVGNINSEALLPCLMSAFIGKYVAGLLGVEPEIFNLTMDTDIVPANFLPLLVLGVLIAILGIVFVELLHNTPKILKKVLPNPYLRIVAASIVFIVLTLLIGTRDYCGSSMGLIEESLEGHVQMEAFALKMIFTALALGSGFKGGEIIPTLCVGATFGCAFGTLIGFNPALMAACGMIGLFSAVTNCPISAILIGIEMFKGQGIACFAFTVVIAFCLSGFFSLYTSQQFTCGKTITLAEESTEDTPVS